MPRAIRTIPVVALVLATLAMPCAVGAQGGTEIYVASLYESERGVVIGAPVNVTRRAGYDNQPWFLDANSFLFSSAVDTSGATDVFRYDIGAAVRTRVTDTPESEYSPTLMPGGRHFSSVRVEMDGTQRLWRFDLDGRNPEVIAADVDSVGYHAWRDDHTVALFIVGEPHSLRVVDTARGTETLIALDIGRALHAIPGRDEVSFLHRIDDEWMFARLDTETGDTTPFAVALEGSQDCAWTPAGRLLMAAEGKVYSLDARRHRWEPLVAFGDPALSSLTRMAIDPTGRWIAIVASEVAR